MALAAAVAFVALKLVPKDERAALRSVADGVAAGS